MAYHLECVDGVSEMFKNARRFEYELLETISFNNSVEHDGEIIACGGLAPAWPDSETRAIAWMLIDRAKPRLFPFIHKNVLRALNEAPYRRIEAFTDPTFKPAERWIRMLGFEIEVPYKPYYFPDGRAAQEWVRIR